MERLLNNGLQLDLFAGGVGFHVQVTWQRGVKRYQAQTLAERIQEDSRFGSKLGSLEEWRKLQMSMAIGAQLQYVNERIKQEL